MYCHFILPFRLHDYHCTTIAQPLGSSKIYINSKINSVSNRSSKRQAMLLVVLSCLLCISVSFPVPIDRTKLSVHHTIFDEYHTSDGFIHSVFIDRNSNYINWGKVNWDSHTTEDETTKNETIWEEMKSLKRSRGLGGLGFLRKVFLPVGYPNSVPPEYLRYQCWNLIQDSCSYLRGIMSTQAILEVKGIAYIDFCHFI